MSSSKLSERAWRMLEADDDIESVHARTQLSIAVLTGMMHDINRGYASGCGKGCGMRKTTRRGRRTVDTGERIDWGAFISAHHDLIDRYRRAPALNLRDATEYHTIE